MYCEKCGMIMRENDEFCSNCGEKRKDIKKISRKQKVWNVFANLGFGFGIASFVLSFFTIVFKGAFSDFLVAGFVFSILGKKSLRYIDRARKGLTFSIIALFISICFYSLLIFIEIVSAIYGL